MLITRWLVTGQIKKSVNLKVSMIFWSLYCSGHSNDFRFH